LLKSTINPTSRGEVCKLRLQIAPSYVRFYEVFGGSVLAEEEGRHRKIMDLQKIKNKRSHGCLPGVNHCPK
jgi:hypothetical protein